MKKNLQYCPSYETFGEMMRVHRLKSFDPARRRPFSQGRLAETLASEIGIPAVSTVSVSNWERNVYQIHKDDRNTLVGLVYIFHTYGHLHTLEAANEFLHSGNYRGLNKVERMRVDLCWVQ